MYSNTVDFATCKLIGIDGTYVERQALGCIVEFSHVCVCMCI